MVHTGLALLWCTHAAGAGVALVTVDRLMFLACSRTLILASTIDEEAAAFVDLALEANAKVDFEEPCTTRTFDAGRAIVDCRSSERREEEEKEKP